MMKNANYIIGYVANNTGYIRDDWGNSQTTHVSDIGLGGTDNATLISASEAGGVTSLEFTIPLNSGDSKDKLLVVGGTYHIIFAKGIDDNFDGMHNSFGVSIITLH